MRRVERGLRLQVEAMAAAVWIDDRNGAPLSHAEQDSMAGEQEAKGHGKIGAMMAAPAGALTEQEYWRMFHSVRGDVEAAIKTDFAYLKIHNLAAAERDIYERYQRDNHFWTLIPYSLQTSFFVAFGRIFDTRRDVFSIHKLVAATIQNPQFFSRAALRQRKRSASNIFGDDPEWLVDYVSQAWEPTGTDLQPLKDGLDPHFAKFKSIYQPIRHRYFAHRGTDSQQAIEALFSQTLIADVNAILGFLHTLLWAIQEIAWNAARPDLTNFNDYNNFVRRLDEEVERFIRRVP